MVRQARQEAGSAPTQARSEVPLAEIANTPVLLYVLCVEPSGRMYFESLSGACEAVLGMSAQSACADARTALRDLAPRDLAQLQTLSANIQEHAPAWTYEFSRTEKNGDQHWFLGRAQGLRQSDGRMLWCGGVMDITAQKQALLSMQESEKRFRTLTRLSADWFWEQDEEHRFVRIYGNLDPNLAHVTQSMIGKTRWEVDARGVSEDAWAVHRAQLNARETFHDFEIQRVRSDGSLMWISVSGLPLFDEHGTFSGYYGIGRDISARKQVELEIERLAFYDVLTGLPNRRMLIDRLQQALDFSARRATYGALLFIDLDNFKILNDTLGHQMGDELLKQVAQRLGKCVRSIDTVARLGGDEFVVMLEEIGSNSAQAAALAETVGYKIVNMLNQEYRLGAQHHHHSSPSIGVTLFYQREHSIDELLKRADLAMYQAKAAGRNTLRFFDPEMQAAASARASMEKDLRQALARGQFVFHYQPIVNEHGHMTGVEALLRWAHPVRGLLAPSEFIPVAEQTGLFMVLGQWVLDTACAQLVAWSQRPATQHLTIAVNISARQFKHSDFSVQIVNALRTSGANPQCLKLELTESLLLGDIQDAARKMEELRTMGVGFLLDDFGTGYSSLSHLKRLPLDHLKIDKSFVGDVLNNSHDAAIVCTILKLAQSLGMGVVAEGVETPQQHAFLRDNGCKAFQGYLFGKPVPLHQLRLAKN